MKVVVTGANGFLGSWVVRALGELGCDVHALVRPTSDLSELTGAKFTAVFGDVTDRESLDRAFEETDTVFHLAGVVSYLKSDRSLLEKVNVDGARNVVEAVRAMKVRRLVHLSSVTAIGAGFTPDQVLNEESEYNLAHWNIGYFETKRRGELIVREAAARGEIDAVILNPSAIYGRGDALKGSRDTQVKVAQGRFPFYTSGGLGVLAIEDAVSGILAGWKQGRSGERYILAGENLTIRRLFEEIARISGVQPPRFRMPDSLLFGLGLWGDFKLRLGLKSSFSLDKARAAVVYNWFDSSKARRELGFNPRPASEALKASVEWMREHGLLETKT